MYSLFLAFHLCKFYYSRTLLMKVASCCLKVWIVLGFEVKVSLGHNLLYGLGFLTCLQAAPCLELFSLTATGIQSLCPLDVCCGVGVYMSFLKCASNLNGELSWDLCESMVCGGLLHHAQPGYGYPGEVLAGHGHGRKDSLAVSIYVAV